MSATLHDIETSIKDRTRLIQGVLHPKVKKRQYLRIEHMAAKAPHSASALCKR